ncbi:MAG: penicillin-binding protein 1A, partial [Acetobacteraceae bacterium]
MNRKPLTAGERLGDAARPRTAASARAKPDRPKGGKDGRNAKPAPRRRRGFWRTLARVVLFAGLAGVAVVVGLFVHYSAGLPSIRGLKHYQPPALSQVYADNFALVSELATQRRLFVPYAQIPAVVRNAFVSAEDRYFWVEPGINPLAILRAAFTDIRLLAEGKRPIGASTITQQLARDMLLNDQLSLARKIREAILAVRINRALSRQRVLELYLNQIYLGEQSYGIGAAAQAYFAKPLDRLDLAEAATLAALPKAPSYYDPFLHPAAAKARRDWVLGRMVADGYISRAQAAAAAAEPIIPKAAGRLKVVPGAGYFADTVRHQLIRRFGLKTTTEGGLVVRTTLDPRLQAAAMAAVRWQLMRYDRNFDGWRGPVARLASTAPAAWPGLLAKVAAPPGMLHHWKLALVLSVTPAAARMGYLAGSKPMTGTIPFADTRWARPALKGRGLGAFPSAMGQVLHPGEVVMVTFRPAAGKLAAHLLLRQIPLVQGALVSLDPRTGRVLAMVGGWSYRRSQFNRVMEAQRQPGSGFKPIAYLTAMEEGIPPDATVLDAPFVLDMGAAGQYRPGDYETGFLGPVPVHKALEDSLNLATLHLAREVGLANIAKNAVAFGLVKHMPLIYPAVLGALDTTVIKMAAAYASLDEGGRKVTPVLIDTVADRRGRILYRAPDLSCPTCAGPKTVPPELTVSRPRIADAASTFQVVQMMQGVVTRGTGVPAGAGFHREIAGKTGTTSNFHDAWFNGFTP